MQTKQVQLPSNDGVHKLHVVVWEPDTQIRAILQLSHGMVEFIERYENFAHYLNEKGILVVGNDHLGHGQTAGKDEDLGYFCPNNMSATVVDDLHSVTSYMKKQYPGVPYFLLGHSMGSFMARRYIMTYGSELDGAIISGTAKQSGISLCAGKLVASVIKACKGERYRSTFLKNAAFGANNKRFQPARTENDWLTRDTEIVDWYNANKYCTFLFTVNGFQTLFEVLTFIQKKDNYSKIPKNLPLFFVAGADDPVGAYGKGVTAVYQSYQNIGIADISMKLYEGDRHEILNELDRETVYADIAQWLLKHME